MRMHRTPSRRIVLLCCLFLLSGVAVGLIGEAMAVPNQASVVRRVIAGGGGHAETVPYSLDGTIGQPVVGTAGDFPRLLCSGFWCGIRGYMAHLPVVVRNH
jgi:hypothetical protein